MGTTRDSAADWSTYRSSTTAGRTYDEVRTSKGVHDIKKEALPANISVRECRDSAANPNSTPIALFLDETGSMGPVLSAAMDGFAQLFIQINEKDPVPDPSILAGMFDDIHAGYTPALQVTQFESDKAVAEQFRALYPLHGGGSNRFESYHLPLYFCARKVVADAFEKGRRKGYLFTVGDEHVPDPLTPRHIRTVFGENEQVDNDLSYADCLRMCEPHWDVFHVVVQQGTNYRGETTLRAWTDILGQRAIPLARIEDLASVIVATIEANEGRSHEEIVASYSGSTAVTVGKAIDALTKSRGGADGLVRL